MQSQNPAEMKGACSVVGGVYREITRFPLSDETWGSGGRAAAVIAGFGIHTTLLTAADAKTTSLLSTLAHIFHFEVKTVPILTTRQFHYDHGLSHPEIYPPVNEGDSVEFEVHADKALVFGMLEANPKVFAGRIVYDPQSPAFPKPLDARPEAGPSAVAYVLNAREAQELGESADISEAAAAIAKNYSLEAVIVKRGPHGALVYDHGQVEHIPAYKTESVWPIGSGDVFAAAFAARWAVLEAAPVDAANFASRAAALYVDSHVLPVPAEALTTMNEFPFPPLALDGPPLSENEYHVYLAGPFFNIGQSWLIEESRRTLQAMGLKVFSPCHDVGLGTAHDVAPKDLDAIRHSRSVFALVDGLDAGTIFEIGYARSLNIPVVVLAQSTSDEPLKMIRGSGCDVVIDFVTAIYRTSWAAQHG
jgi:nucleoside 2-deoxyribosyltransferase